MNSRQCGAPVAAIRSRANATFLVVLGGRELAAHSTKPQIQQVRVHDVGFAIAAHVVPPARRDRRRDFAAVHPELARKTAQPRHRVEAGRRAQLVHREHVHEIEWRV
jgi:hypothetical protein